MNSKIIATILIAAFCLSDIRHVKAMCEILMSTYYKCKNPNTLLTDSFYKNELDDIGTFNAAMQKYKLVYKELGWNNCSSSLCTCVKKETKLTEWNYGVFFLHPDYYPDLVRIESAVHDKYIPVKSIESSKFSILRNKVLYDYCTKFDYSTHDLHRYNESNKCKHRSEKGLTSCHEHFSNHTDLRNDSIAAENYLTCLARFLSSCEVEMRRALIVHYLSKYPTVIRNDLLTYVNSFMSGEESFNKTFVQNSGGTHLRFFPSIYMFVAFEFLLNLCQRR